jgi:thiol-disulfide isomerase/thioredoxin
MVRSQSLSWIAALFGLLLASTISAQAAERSAPEILSALDAIRMPSFDPSRRGEPGYIDKIKQEFIAVGAKRDALILELLQADPDNERLPTLMNEHWRRLPPTGADEARLNREIADVLSRSRNDKLKTEALFAKAQAAFYKIQSGQARTLDVSGVEEFVERFPKDPRSEQLLYAASVLSPDDKQKVAMEERILKGYPRSRAAEGILGVRRQRESIGKPFDLEFTDAISGSTVSMKNLKGKVVIIDFWATWCGPCVAEMPHMKELYSKYHNRGVEFIGVSLDQSKEEGGLDSLKSYVKQNGITWPQYYQGKFWDSDFSKSWGINAIPAVFVVDTEGKLYSVQGVRHLDEMIPGLLGKKAGAPKDPAGGG